MRTLAKIFISTVFFSLIIPQATMASCIMQTPKEQLAQAEVVVEARITKVKVSATSTTITGAVENTIKGDVGKTLTFTINSGTNLATSVDVAFDEGQTYELYLYRDETGQLTTNTCTGTKLLAPANNVGDNYPTQPTYNESIDVTQNRTPWIVSAGILIMAIVAMACLAIKR